MGHSAITIMGKTNLREINLLGINKRIGLWEIKPKLKPPLGSNSLLFSWFFCLPLRQAVHGMGKGSCSQSFSSTFFPDLGVCNDVSLMAFFSSLFSLTAAAQLFYPLLNVLSQRHPRSQLGPAWWSLSSQWPPLRTGCGLGETNCTETHNMILNIGIAVTQNWSSSSCLVLLKYLWNCLLAYW